MKEIAPTIYASTKYPGVNVGFVVTSAGAIAVDAPTLPHDARAWQQQIREIAGNPILYVVLTDTHPDRLLSARSLQAPIVATREAYDQASVYTEGFWRGVVESWARRHPEAADDLSAAEVALPEVMFTEHVTLHKGGTEVTVKHIAGATPGSAWIHLPESNVLFAGDTVVVETHPFLAGASDTKAWLNTLTSLRRASFSQTMIVPGRGPLCDQSATRPLSEYIALVRRRVRSLHQAGRARSDTAGLVAELLPLFPTPEDERDLAQRRIKASLDQVYEELQPEQK